MTDITVHWHWPQWTMLTFTFIAMIIKMGNHGKARTNQNGFYAIADFALLMFILICGGFFA